MDSETLVHFNVTEAIKQLKATNQNIRALSKRIDKEAPALKFRTRKINMAVTHISKGIAILEGKE